MREKSERVSPQVVDRRDGIDHRPLSCIRLPGELLQVKRSRCLSHQRASTSDADEISNYIERALDLMPWEGNPVWIFPTPRTDFAMTRSDLMRLLETARDLALEGKGASTCQQDVDRIKDSSVGIKDRVKEAEALYFAGPQTPLLTAL